MQRRAYAALLAATASAMAAAAFLAGGAPAATSPRCNYGEITLNVSPVLSAPNPTHPGDTITSSGGSWTSCGVPFSGFYKEWLRDGVVISGPVLVPGAPASFTYTVQSADVGHAIRSAVRPCNDESGCYASFVQSSNAITPTNPPPPPPPPPSPVVAQGYVRDPTGVPVSDALVELYRDPVVGSAVFSPLDSATTGTDGFFVLRSPYTDELRGDAAANGGYVNFDILGASEDATYYDGVTRTFDDAAGIWLTPEQAVADDRSRVADQMLDLEPVPDDSLGPGATGSPWCLITTKRKTLLATERDSTVIGELLVARDAVGTFSFGRGTEHVSNISVGVDLGHGWHLGAFAHAATGDTSGVSISNVGDDWARQLRSDFVYAKYRKQTVNPWGDVCSTWYTIEPKEWVGGGIVPGADESQYLHQCLTTYARWRINQGPASSWFRASNKLRTWGAAATVDLGSGGLGLQAWTGLPGGSGTTTTSGRGSTTTICAATTTTRSAPAASSPVASVRTIRWLGASLLAGGLAATVVVVIVLTGGSDGGVVRGGPLAEPGFRMGEAAAMDVGKAGTYGMETITNHGHATAVLDRVAFVERSPGLEILGPLLMHLRDRPGTPALATGLIRRFPPPHEGATLHPVAGFRISPHRSWRDDAEVLIGFRAHRTGVLFYRALELYYHVGDRRYVATYPDPLTICAPYSFPLSRCKPP